MNDIVTPYEVNHAIYDVMHPSAYLPLSDEYLIAYHMVNQTVNPLLITEMSASDATYDAIMYNV